MHRSKDGKREPATLFSLRARGRGRTQAAKAILPGRRAAIRGNPALSPEQQKFLFAAFAPVIEARQRRL